MGIRESFSFIIGSFFFFRFFSSQFLRCTDSMIGGSSELDEYVAVYAPSMMAHSFSSVALKLDLRHGKRICSNIPVLTLACRRRWASKKEYRVKQKMTNTNDLNFDQ